MAKIARENTGSEKAGPEAKPDRVMMALQDTEKVLKARIETTIPSFPEETRAGAMRQAQTRLAHTQELIKKRKNNV